MIPRGPGTVPDVRERKALFLKEFAEVPQRAKVSILTGIPYTTVSKWMVEDQEFASKVREIRSEYLARVGDIAEMGVIEGVSNPTRPNPWLALEVARHLHPDWKRETPNSLTQVNIETAILNPHVPQAPTGGGVSNREDVPQVGHLDTGETGEPGNE